MNRGIGRSSKVRGSDVQEGWLSNWGIVELMNWEELGRER